MRKYALALLAAAGIAATVSGALPALGDTGATADPSAVPACPLAADAAVQQGQKAADAAFARKKWRQEHPMKRGQQNRLVLAHQCAAERDAELTRYIHLRRKAFFAYADKQFRACEPRDCQLWASRFVHGAQFRCLVALWNRESGWDRLQPNTAGSGAYGIPQALPGYKMGPGWETDAKVQIGWGIDYIHGSYGTPCSADAAQSSQGWY